MVRDFCNFSFKIYKTLPYNFHLNTSLEWNIFINPVLSALCL
ncbi:hypothetical protein TRIP_E160219 [uncultured Spirochaetota bacterium]|nr:hypothetical protein TRIP_E160219 [uncultured Spirochaetota bacterium]